MPDSNSITSELKYKVNLIQYIHPKCLVSVVREIYINSATEHARHHHAIYLGVKGTQATKWSFMVLPVHSPASPIFHCGLFSSQFFSLNWGESSQLAIATLLALCPSVAYVSKTRTVNTLRGVPYYRFANRYATLK